MTVTTGDPPTALAVADVTGDRIPDLLRGSGRARDLVIHPGLGAGSFASGTGIAVGETVGAIATGDFDEDGDRDIVTANADRSLTVLSMGPGGVVERSATIAVGGAPSAIAQGDVNSDAHADLMVVNASSRSASVVLGRGAAGFERAIFTDIGDFPVDGVLADVTEDGRLDIVAAVQRPAGVTISPGNGDGTFGRPTRLAAGVEPTGVTVADLDRDGHLDIVAANQLSNEITIQRGLGAGRFLAGRRTLTSSLPSDVTTGDWDADGDLDIAATNTGSNDVSILENTGLGLFRPAQQFRVGRTPGNLVSADATGDGVPDLVVANSGGASLSILTPRGFRPPGTAKRRVRCPANRIRAIAEFETRCVALTMSHAQVMELMGTRRGSRRIDQDGSVRWHYPDLLITFSGTFNFVTAIRTRVHGARTTRGIAVDAVVGDLSRRLDPEFASCRTSGGRQQCVEAALFTQTQYLVIRGRVAWIEIGLSPALSTSTFASASQPAAVARAFDAIRRVPAERGTHGR